MEGKIAHRYCFGFLEFDGKDAFFRMEGVVRSMECILAIEIYGCNDDYFMILDLAPTSDAQMGDMVSKLWESLGRPDRPSGKGRSGKLERIFKRNGDEGGQRTVRTEKFKRTVMTLELEPDEVLVQEYKRLHRPENIWPQILMNMDSIGVLDMEIYLKEHRAFLVMDTKPDFDMARDGQQWAAMPREKEWQAHVARFQKADPMGKAIEKWKIMSRIFRA